MGGCTAVHDAGRSATLNMAMPATWEAMKEILEEGVSRRRLMIKSAAAA
jgi:hypothetical protein